MTREELEEAARMLAARNAVNKQTGKKIAQDVDESKDEVSRVVNEDDNMTPLQKEEAHIAVSDTNRVNQAAQRNMETSEAKKGGSRLSDKFLDALTYFGPQLIGGALSQQLSGTGDEGFIAGFDKAGQLRDSYIGYKQGQAELDLKQATAQANARPWQQSQQWMTKDGKPVVMNPNDGQFYEPGSQVPVRRDNIVNALMQRHQGSLDVRQAGQTLKEEKAKELSEQQVKSYKGFKSAQKSIARIRDLKSKVDTGPIAKLIQSGKEFADVASPKAVALKAETESLVADYIKAISGAQASELEVARLKRVSPTFGDNDKVFKNKLDQFEKIMSANEEALNEAIRTGQPLRGKLKFLSDSKEEKTKGKGRAIMSDAQRERLKQLRGR